MRIRFIEVGLNDSDEFGRHSMHIFHTVFISNTLDGESKL